MKPEIARRLVRDAVKRGDLCRPSHCSKCGKTPPVQKNGRTSIQGHHHDYEKPLDVEWLCAKCHRAVTPLPKVMGAPTPGERNGQSKLKEQDILFIRQSPLGCVRLGNQFNVDKKQIQRIRRGESWTHV